MVNYPLSDYGGIRRIFSSPKRQNNKDRFFDAVPKEMLIRSAEANQEPHSHFASWLCKLALIPFPNVFRGNRSLLAPLRSAISFLCVPGGIPPLNPWLLDVIPLG
jgi:hypothetical protein